MSRCTTLPYHRANVLFKVFRRAVFPTHFVTRRVQCLQSPRPDLFYLPLSRTLKTYLNHENEPMRKQLEALGKEKRLDEVQQPEKKWKTTEVEGEKKRRWIVNSPIRNTMRNHVYFVDIEETNAPLLDMILRGEFVALYGARFSGKTTRVLQVMEQLESQGIVCIHVSLLQLNVKDIDSFWLSIDLALYLGAPKYFRRYDVQSSDDFLFKFHKEQWNGNRVVLFINNYDKLLEAHKDIRSSFLETMRLMKSTKENYALLSSVAIGPFSILRLNTGKTFRNPNFTWEQVQTVYKEFENDFKLIIDPEVIEDIYNRTNGYAFLVCLCGSAIHSYLMAKPEGYRRLSFSTWLNFVIDSMQDNIADHNAEMINALTEEEARPAIKLLRSAFLGSLNFVPIYSSEEIRLAEFLTAEGVLVKDEMKENNFRMSSIFVDELIRQQVIPNLYKSAPTCAVPRKRDRTLDIINILKMAVQYFDKEVIYEAFDQSFKIAHVYVNGQKDIPVPRESVYDTELSRILVNWVAEQVGNCMVTGQWHLVANEKDEHAYSDTIIKTSREIIVLELLATATKKELDEHFIKVLDYAEKLSANEIWIIHFTCEDYKTPYWPSNRKFEKINIVHFFHDRMLKNIQLSVRSVSTPGTFKYINEVVRKYLLL